jgi:hypothetical protein
MVADRRQVDLDYLLRSQSQCFEPLLTQSLPLPFLMLVRMCIEMVVAAPAQRFGVLRIKPNRLQPPAVEVGALELRPIECETPMAPGADPVRPCSDQLRELPIIIMNRH